MIGKTILLLIVASVAVQSYVPYNTEEELSLFDKEGGSFIDELKKIIEEAIAAVKTAVDDFYNHLSQEIKEIIQQAEAIFEKDLKQLLDELEKIKEEADKLKVDISECLKDNEIALKNLSVKYRKNIIHCTEDVVNKGKAIVEEAENSFEESRQKVKSLIAEFEACGSGVGAIACKAQVSVKIGQAIVEVPLKLKSILEKEIPSVIDLVPAAHQCVVKTTNEFAAEGQKILKDIETCVDHKIHPNKEA